MFLFSSASPSLKTASDAITAKMISTPKHISMYVMLHLKLKKRIMMKDEEEEGQEAISTIETEAKTIYTHPMKAGK